ncbi:MAG: molybdopterin-guanine dinucleotide biosynthesis protein B [Firmicutes bacterium]|nr:molybdopterin-guanine dinucleotide biosynthesis protein B [Bacillota bacterium]
MRVFSVCGITQSGKTTTIENIIREFKKRKYSVGSVKEIHYEEFEIDDEGTNTYRHKTAGSSLVTARGYNETDILYQKKLSIEDILKFYYHDYVVLEGVMDSNVPKIITAHTTKEIDEKLDGLVFAISGRIAEDITEYKGIPVINSIKDIEKLVDLIEEKVYRKIPDFKEECLGFDTKEIGAKILNDEINREDIDNNSKIKLLIDDTEIDLVPFVQNILYNSVIGVVKELDGFKKSSKIKIEIEEVR